MAEIVPDAWSLATFDIYRLARMYVHDQISAEVYFAEVEKRAKVAIEREIAAESQERPSSIEYDGGLSVGWALVCWVIAGLMLTLLVLAVVHA